MSNRSVKSIARRLSFNSSGGIAYGKRNDVFANITNVAFTGTITFTVNELEPKELQAIMEFLERNKKPFLIRGDPRYENPFLFIDLDSHYAPLTTKRILETFTQVCTFLHTLGVRSRCTGCKKADASFAIGGRAVYLLCEECCNKEEEKALKAYAEQGKGSYLTGFLGALAGGAAGMLPWILFGMLRLINAASGLVMAWLCVAGYIKFKGKIRKPMVPIILLVLIVFTAAGVVAADAVYLMQQGYTDMGEILTEIFSDLTLSGISADIILGLFMAGIGAFAFLRNALRATSKRKFEKHV